MTQTITNLCSRIIDDAGAAGIIANEIQALGGLEAARAAIALQEAQQRLNSALDQLRLLQAMQADPVEVEV